MSASPNNRQERLAAALRENLKRRKQQIRGRESAQEPLEERLIGGRDAESPLAAASTPGNDQADIKDQACAKACTMDKGSD